MRQALLAFETIKPTPIPVLPRLAVRAGRQALLSPSCRTVKGQW